MSALREKYISEKRIQKQIAHCLRRIGHCHENLTPLQGRRGALGDHRPAANPPERISQTDNATSPLQDNESCFARDYARKSIGKYQGCCIVENYNFHMVGIR